MFLYGTKLIRADFHMHTKSDKEFKYVGDVNYFVSNYIDKLEDENRNLGLRLDNEKQ